MTDEAVSSPPRLLLSGFDESEEMVERVWEFLRDAPAVIIGWSARSDRERCIRRTAGVPFWRVPLGKQARSSPWPPLDVGQMRFSAIEEENFYYMLERHYSGISRLEATFLFYEIVLYARRALVESGPTAVLFSDVPHNAFSYALYLLARREGIRTLIVKWGPAPHLFYFIDDVDRGIEQVLAMDEADAETGSEAAVSSSTELYLSSIARRYEDAMPQYTRAQMRLAGWLGRARAIVERPRRLLRGRPLSKAVQMARRDLVKRRYQRLATATIDESCPSVAVFLHLQPERSTMPEGGAFAQQWLLVHQVATALPNGWRIYVREHPATFYPGPRLLRGAWFYEALLSLPAVELVSLDVEPFALIDACRCVATVTGTVGFEALGRGKPVLLFGRASYSGFDGVYEVSDRTSCAGALAEIEAGRAVDADRLRSRLARIERAARVVTTPYRPEEDFAEFVRSGIGHCQILERMIEELTANLRSGGSDRPGDLS